MRSAGVTRNVVPRVIAFCGPPSGAGSRVSPHTVFLGLVQPGEHLAALAARAGVSYPKGLTIFWGRD